MEKTNTRKTSPRKPVQAKTAAKNTAVSSGAVRNGTTKKTVSTARKGNASTHGAARKKTGTETQMNWDPFFDARQSGAGAKNSGTRKKTSRAAQSDAFYRDDLFDTPSGAPKRRSKKKHQDDGFDDFFSENLFDADSSNESKNKKRRDASDDAFFQDDLFDELPKKQPGHKGKGGGKRDWWSVPMAVVLLLILAFAGYMATNNVTAYAQFREMRDTVERATFYPGITIDGTDVSGMTYQEALSRWAQEDEKQRGRYRVTLTFEGRDWTLTSDDLGYYNDYAEVIAGAYAVGRYGSLEARYAQTRSGDGQSRAYTVTRGADKEALRTHVQAIADELTIPPVSAKIQSFDKETLTFVYTEAQAGLVVDKQGLYDTVVETINGGGSAVAITRERVEPGRSAAELGALYGQVSTATTNASSSSSNRISNIRLACQSIDGYLVKPGATFSFNEVVGKRTKDRGYKKAGAIENGVMTEQYGGGICQVSTTLFNAVAKADLEITERSPHSRPSTYVDIGKDAVVDWPNKDFKFKNNTDSPVYISARVSDDKRVVIKIFGMKLADGMSIQIESKKTSTISPGKDKYVLNENLAPGATKVVESARSGYKAEAYKVYLDRDGNEIKREPLCKSTYSAAGAVIHIGP